MTWFILLGLTDDQALELPLFILFLLIYTIPLMGNLGIILLIVLDSQLLPCIFSLVIYHWWTSVTPQESLRKLWLGF